VPLRQSLRTQDVGGSVAEHAGRNTEWSVPKTLIFTPSADLESGTGAQEIGARLEVTLVEIVPAARIKVLVLDFLRPFSRVTVFKITRR
jgi:hypothetical protein